MKRKILLLLTFGLTVVCSVFGQTKNNYYEKIKNKHHEISAAGGYITMYPGRRENKHGFSLAAFYQYTPCRWVGMQTGIQYNNHIKLEAHNDESFHAPLQIPFYIVLFPKFRYNLLGGIYYEKITGSVAKENIGFVKKKDVLGYGLGIRRNWKYAKLRLEFKRGFNPWLDLRPGAYGELQHPLKNWSINASIEIPLWRH